MNQTELEILLRTTGYPVTYRQFIVDKKNPSPEPPYIVYLFTNSSNFGADNRVYYKTGNYQVELYVLKKEISIENKLESIFDSVGIFWEKSESYIDTEDLYQIVYEINV